MTEPEKIFGTELKKFSGRGALGGTGGGEKKSPTQSPTQSSPILSSDEKNFAEPAPILSSDEKNFAEPAPILSSSEKISDPPPPSAVTPPVNFPLESQKILAPLTARDIEDLKTLDEIIPNWRNRILELAAEGKSQIEIRVALCKDSGGVFKPDIWSTLKNREAVIADYFDQAKEIAEAHWAEMGRNLLTHEKGTVVEASIWIFSMKNRFGWRDTKPGDLVPEAMRAMGNVMQQVRARMAEAQSENAQNGITHVPKPKGKGGRKTNAERKQRAKAQGS